MQQAELIREERPDRLGRTAVGYRAVPEILTRATGFIGSYDYTLNPYTGQNSWGEWVTAKENAGRLVRSMRPGALDGKRIYMSSVTDPYQPLERKVNLTRSVLESLAERHAPKLVVQTRSPLALRDADLFRRIEERGGRVQVNMTVTTDDDEVRRAFEPGCPTNAARLRAVGKIRAEGIQCCVTMTPLPRGGGQDDSPDPGGGLPVDGGEAGLRAAGVPPGVRPALPGGPGRAEVPAAGAGGGPERVPAALLGKGKEKIVNDGKERDNEPGRRKSWIENWWVWYGYGAGMGAMSAIFFLAQGIRLLNEGHVWPGIVNLILAVVFPTATMWGVRRMWKR